MVDRLFIIVPRKLYLRLEKKKCNSRTVCIEIYRYKKPRSKRSNFIKIGNTNTFRKYQGGREGVKTGKRSWIWVSFIRMMIFGFFYCFNLEIRFRLFCFEILEITWRIYSRPINFPISQVPVPVHIVQKTFYELTLKYEMHKNVLIL